MNAEKKETLNNLQMRRELIGVVVSDKMEKTIVVKVSRKVKHPLYKKFVLKTARYKAHDEGNIAKVGDEVLLLESRPLSRHKRWVMTKVVRSLEQEVKAL
jgi:small subunit ribosomal protein S17